MGAWSEPSPSDVEAICADIRSGTDPFVATRKLGFTGSAMRRLGNKDAAVARAYAEAKLARHELIRDAGKPTATKGAGVELTGEATIGAIRAQLVRLGAADEFDVVALPDGRAALVEREAAA